jgi:hypothetical protein
MLKGHFGYQWPVWMLKVLCFFGFVVDTDVLADLVLFGCLLLARPVSLFPTLYDSVLCECPVVKWSSCVRRRLASARGCRGSTRLRRLVLAAAFALAGSAIDEAFQTPPLTSDTHSLLIQRALFLLCL